MPIVLMKEKMPPIYTELHDTVKMLEKHMHDMQDTEFTVQDGRLFMLQTRNGKRTGPAALKIAIDLEAEVREYSWDGAGLAGNTTCVGTAAAAVAVAWCLVQESASFAPCTAATHLGDSMLSCICPSDSPPEGRCKLTLSHLGRYQSLLCLHPPPCLVSQPVSLHWLHPPLYPYNP